MPSGNPRPSGAGGAKDPSNHFQLNVSVVNFVPGNSYSTTFFSGCPLTEALLLGVVANRFPDQKLNWDANALQVTNVSEANQYLQRTYRKGFEVENLTPAKLRKAGCP